MEIESVIYCVLTMKLETKERSKERSKESFQTRKEKNGIKVWSLENELERKVFG